MWFWIYWCLHYFELDMLLYSRFTLNRLPELNTKVTRAVQRSQSTAMSSPIVTLSPIYLSISISFLITNRLDYHPSIYLSTHTSIYVYIHLSIYLSTHPFIHLHFHPFIFPSTLPSFPQLPSLHPHWLFTQYSYSCSPQFCHLDRSGLRTYSCTVWCSHTSTHVLVFSWQNWKNRLVGVVCVLNYWWCCFIVLDGRDLNFNLTWTIT